MDGIVFGILPQNQRIEETQLAKQKLQNGRKKLRILKFPLKEKGNKFYNLPDAIQLITFFSLARQRLLMRSPASVSAAALKKKRI